MHICSTINPLTKSSQDVPVTLVCHGGKKKFVLKPKTYEVGIFCNYDCVVS